MTDSDIQKIIKSILDTGLTAQGLTIIVAQSFNPTKQGVPLEPTVLFTKITARRFGWQGRKQVYDQGLDQFDKTEGYFLKATYQINAVIQQDINDPNSLNAYDVVELCSAILQTQESVQTFVASEIGIERITEIRTPHILDDSDKFDIEPSFDFVLSYQNTLTSIVPSASIDGVVQNV